MHFHQPTNVNFSVRFNLQAKYIFPAAPRFYTHTNNRRNILIKSTPSRKKAEKSDVKKGEKKGNRMKGYMQWRKLTICKCYPCFLIHRTNPLFYHLHTFTRHLKRVPSKAPSIFALIRFNVKFCLTFACIIVLTRTSLHVYMSLTLYRMLVLLFCKNRKKPKYLRRVSMKMKYPTRENVRLEEERKGILYQRKWWMYSKVFGGIHVVRHFTNACQIRFGRWNFMS